ncbi:hypothetical protein GCM10023200_00580 [Actinomycetospora chlora]|uniref:Glycosyltransferase 2-like domain-containing protein n=1 Tax=Actinomycetospora chlora TaxID=663608 RepID=A0ABP9A1N5_9PSEU
MGIPGVALVVPAYRTRDVVGELIDSVLAQSRADWELVVVDDASPDQLHEVVTPYLTDPRIRLVRLPDNRGVSAARNEGAARTSAELVAFLDSDDLVEPGFVERVAAAMETPSVGIAGVIPAVTGPDGEPSTLPGTDARPPSSPDDTEAWLLHLLRHPFHFRGTTVRRTVWDKAGGFAEDLWLGEDLELWVRVVLTGCSVRVVEQPCYVHRLAGESITRQSDRTVERSLAHLAALDRIEAQLPATPEHAAALAAARRIPRSLEGAGRFRRAARAGDGPAARHHARTLARLDPGPRTRLLRAVSLVPSPVLRGVYRAGRRLRGLPPA